MFCPISSALKYCIIGIGIFFTTDVVSHIIECIRSGEDLDMFVQRMHVRDIRGTLLMEEDMNKREALRDWYLDEIEMVDIEE